MAPIKDEERPGIIATIAALSPDQLLTMQKVSNYLRSHDKVRAEQLLTITNDELIKRGLCTICAKPHTASTCPVIQNINDIINGDDDLAGGVIA